jgi:hypothetical protein
MLGPEHGTFGRRLAAMGHEVGLTYDVKFLEAFPRQEWRDLIRMQATLLGELSGTRVTAIVMHQPGLNGEDPMRHTGEYMNAYDDPFFRDIPYFRSHAAALQLGLHPINWAEHDRDRETIFGTLHSNLARSVESAGDGLLRRIAEHHGVLQHQARGAKR